VIGSLHPVCKYFESRIEPSAMIGCVSVLQEKYVCMYVCTYIFSQIMDGLDREKTERCHGLLLGDP